MPVSSFDGRTTWLGLCRHVVRVAPLWLGAALLAGAFYAHDRGWLDGRNEVAVEVTLVLELVPSAPSLVSGSTGLASLHGGSAGLLRRLQSFQTASDVFRAVYPDRRVDRRDIERFRLTQVDIRQHRGSGLVLCTLRAASRADALSLARGYVSIVNRRVQTELATEQRRIAGTLRGIAHAQTDTATHRRLASELANDLLNALERTSVSRPVRVVDILPSAGDDGRLVPFAWLGVAGAALCGAVASLAMSIGALHSSGR